MARPAATSGIYPPEKLAEIGETVVTAYERDKVDRKDWEDTAREALAHARRRAFQAAKEFPWPNAST
jgi:hypothetical protein